MIASAQFSVCAGFAAAVFSGFAAFGAAFGATAFGAGFALDQFRRDLDDLIKRARERAARGGGGVGG